MKFRTELNKYETFNVIDYSKQILCIGSCFAEHLHTYLQRRKYSTFLNPCGITYNAHSILKSIQYAIGKLKVDAHKIAEYNGIYSHPDFHSCFSAPSMEEVLENIRLHLEQATSYIKSDVVILSLGTAFAYHEMETDDIVNNCHKHPGSLFEKKLMTVAEVTESLNEAVALLKRLNPDVKIVGTVSPVRHLRDGMINNNRSKSILNLALHSVSEILYFPSYELLLDDLRDYRFYDRDFVHPSDEAVDYILSFFEGQFLSEVEVHLRNQVVQIQKDLDHRAFFPDSEQHQNFLRKLIEKMQAIQDNNPVDFKKELELAKSRLL